MSCPWRSSRNGFWLREEESEELFEEVDLGLLGVEALTKFSDGVVL